MNDKTENHFIIKWVDGEREPKSPPNPDHPSGVDLDASDGAAIKCCAALPYPAARCGMYFIDCRICGIRVACTTAGRPDDPRSIIIACKPR